MRAIDKSNKTKEPWTENMDESTIIAIILGIISTIAGIYILSAWGAN